MQKTCSASSPRFSYWPRIFLRSSVLKLRISFCSTCSSIALNTGCWGYSLSATLDTLISGKPLCREFSSKGSA